MPLEQTITIVNNSGKIISTGKHLVSIFKEAKASYQDKKAQLKSERALNRAQTFTAPPPSHRRHHHDHHHDYETYYDDDYDYDYEHDRRSRQSHDAQSDTRSRTTRRSKSMRSKGHDRHHSHKDRSGARSRPALTENNLKTLSEVSSTAPSRVPQQHPTQYQSPYAETLPHDMALSRMDLPQTELYSMATPRSELRRSMTMPHRRSLSELDYEPGPHGKDIDMHLAYGNVPPDLESRHDLDPAYQEETKKQRARDLVQKVEGLLDEAHCVQHSATAMISHLQENPDAAAAVALTLAELSTIVSKMSPAFIGFLKGGSPAVFALLASPQFLIGTGIAVGVTVVMFGGWKIVKKVKEAKAAREAALMGVEANPMGQQQQQQQHGASGWDRPVPLRTQSEFSAGMDEALVVDEELSTIESWRRGIPAFSESEGESADMELITPEAERANRHKHSSSNSKSHKSTAKAATRSKRHDASNPPERKSSRNATGKSSKASVAGTEHTNGSSSSKKKKDKDKGKDKDKDKRRDRVEVKAIEDGKSNRGMDDDIGLVLRPRAQRQGSNMLKAIFKNKKDKEMATVERSGDFVLARR